jgi:putative beta-lysine N-acetyltransferase
MQNEQIERLVGSVVAHGSLSDRVYLTVTDQDDPSLALDLALKYADDLVALHNYSKVLARIPAHISQVLEDEGYEVEAAIPKLYNADESCLFMARYNHPDRLVDHAADRVQSVLKVAGETREERPKELPDGCECRFASPEDCRQIAKFYRGIFNYYHAPIGDPGYLAEVMEGSHVYAGIWGQGRLMAMASAEIDHAGGNAELYGFATQVEFQGRGFAKYLLQFLENELSLAGIETGFTLARAPYFGMNIVAAQQGYRYAGTLVKNEKYSAGLESSNVWYKPFTVNRS